MIREDIEIKPWSLARFDSDDARRDIGLRIRMSRMDEAALNEATIEASKRSGRMLRPTDVVRGCLIFCGVFTDPTTQEKEVSSEGKA